MENKIKRYYWWNFGVFMFLGLLDAISTMWGLSIGNGIVEGNPVARFIPIWALIPSQILMISFAYFLFYKGLKLSYNVSWTTPNKTLMSYWFITGVKFWVVVNNFIIVFTHI